MAARFQIWGDITNKRDKLLTFNSIFLLNKAEVIASFDDFVAHHQEKDNEEGYSDGKRKVLLALCAQFRKELVDRDIQPLNKNWFFYDYDVKNDSIELSLYKCDKIEFDNDNEISNMETQLEYTIAEVKCEYLSVEEYAKQYAVTDTTVRQWIRRGKLRTAKKKGRDWIIPALADKPKRGFESVTYFWNLLPIEVINRFPYLKDCNSIYIYQDELNKKLFHCVTYLPENNKGEKIELTIKERESLETCLIGMPGIKIEDFNNCIKYVPEKRVDLKPTLATKATREDEERLMFSDFLVRHHCQDVIAFAADSKPGDLLDDEYPKPYLIHVSLEFFGVAADDECAVYEAMDSGDYNNCTKIGSLWGHFIACHQMFLDGYDIFTVCDDESADLANVVSMLSEVGGPLSEDEWDPAQDIFYIHEFVIEESLRQQGIGTRLLQELPFIIKRFLNLTPHIFAYYVANQNEAKKIETAKMGKRNKANQKNREKSITCFYEKNGFKKIGDNRLLYTFTNL